MPIHAVMPNITPGLAPPAGRVTGGTAKVVVISVNVPWDGSATSQCLIMQHCEGTHIWDGQGYTGALGGVV